jgi:hypothetical protein
MIVGYLVCVRMHINIDEDLLKGIDEQVGPRGRSKYIRDAVSARLEEDRMLAARQRLFGSLPDFAPWMTPEWISENRAREAKKREERLAKHWRRDD